MDINEKIKNVLRFWGPCTVSTIQQKLDMQKIELDQITILNACEFMVRFKEIREADGFGPLLKAFKL